MNRAIDALNARLDDLRQNRRGLEEQLLTARATADKTQKQIDEIDATAKEILRAVEQLRRPPPEAPKPQPDPKPAPKPEPAVADQVPEKAQEKTVEPPTGVFQPVAAEHAKLPGVPSKSKK